MDSEKIIDKLQEIFEEFEKKTSKQKVLVMHPSAMILVKDKITRYRNIYNTREAFLFDGRITLYPSFKLPVNHFAVMTNDEYKEFDKPKN